MDLRFPCRVCRVCPVRVLAGPAPRGETLNQSINQSIKKDACFLCAVLEVGGRSEGVMVCGVGRVAVCAAGRYKDA